ncbi:hypothetical protein [Candidatus Tisiphia endosymbiont of Parasteatoda lunata]|uniref:hypothetical protein n=1 Tax=Candidatus Tisiphia endosymbiont of Parasteatoda lunata TaxID=3066275 RepID=UPI00313C2759
MHDNDLNKKIEYFDNLKSKREKWNQIWDELKKYVCPQTESNKVRSFAVSKIANQLKGGSVQISV